MGLIGLPVPPVTSSGATTSRHSVTPSVGERREHEVLEQREAPLHQQLDVQREERRRRTGSPRPRRCRSRRPRGRGRRCSRPSTRPRPGCRNGGSPPCEVTSANRSSQPVRTSMMSPAPISTPCGDAARLEVVGGDVVPGSSQSTPWWPRDVEQHGPTGEPAGLLDAAVRRAVVRRERRWPTCRCRSGRRRRRGTGRPCGCRCARGSPARPRWRRRPGARRTACSSRRRSGW